MAEYRVNLDIFSGPLDLLLYLVRKEEVDIYDISLTKITNQYLHYIEIMKKLDVDLAGDFLVMAATLMHIKSAMLLPKTDEDEFSDEPLGDARAELIRQLLEYKKFKDAANLLGDAAEEQKTRYARPDIIVDKLKQHSEPEVDLEQVSVWHLLEAFDSVMEAVGASIDISNIKDDTPIDLYQIEILQLLQTEGPMIFERVFESKTGRLVMVGLFLALLELIRDKLVWTEQPDAEGQIYLKALTEEPAEQAVQKAILASETYDEKEQIQQKQQQKTPPIQITELSAKEHKVFPDDAKITNHPDSTTTS